jgi:transposase
VQSRTLAPSLGTIGAFLRVREVAEQLSVSAAIVYALVERGETSTCKSETRQDRA